MAAVVWGPSPAQNGREQCFPQSSLGSYQVRGVSCVDAALGSPVLCERRHQESKERTQPLSAVLPWNDALWPRGYKGERCCINLYTNDRHTTVVSTSEIHRTFSVESEHRYKISYTGLRFPSQEEHSIQSERFSGHKAKAKGESMKEGAGDRE